MESTEGIKRLGDKELELLILRHISENDGVKESEICRAIPARNARIVGYLTHYTGIGVLEMRFSDVSYTSKLYSLTELGEFILCLKVIDCSTVRGNLKVAECGEPDFGGENLRTLTMRLRRLCAKRSDRWDIGPRRPPCELKRFQGVLKGNYSGPLRPTRPGPLADDGIGRNPGRRP